MGNETRTSKQKTKFLRHIAEILLKTATGGVIIQHSIILQTFSKFFCYSQDIHVHWRDDLKKITRLILQLHI